jgi:hypothetical protein
LFLIPQTEDTACAVVAEATRNAARKPSHGINVDTNGPRRLRENFAQAVEGVVVMALDRAVHAHSLYSEIDLPKLTVHPATPCDTLAAGFAPEFPQITWVAIGHT